MQPSLSDNSASSKSPAGEVLEVKIRPGEKRELRLRVSARAVRVTGGDWPKWFQLSARWWWGIALGMALILSFGGLERFPLSFRAAEAFSSLRAASLLRQSEPLQIFYDAVQPDSLSTTVYLQVFLQLLGLDGLFWARALSSMLGLLGAASLAYASFRAYQLPIAWSALPLLTGAPIWLAYARQGSETLAAAGFLAASLAAYALYRYRDRRWLYAAVILGALAFYSAPQARLAIPFTAILLILSDLRYHLAQRKIAFTAAVLAALCAVPLAVYLGVHPEAGSAFWGLGQPAGQHLLQALQGLNPVVWFLPGAVQAADFPLNGQALFSPLLLIPALAGLMSALRQWHDPLQRLAILGWVGAALGGSLSGPSPSHLTLAAGPFALIILLGLALIGTRLQGWKPRLYTLYPGTLAILVCTLGLLTLTGAPRHAANYGREGIQYGAAQIYALVNRYAQSNPDKTVLVSPEWSSNADEMRQFFAPDQERIQTGTIQGYLHTIRSDISRHAFLMTTREYEQVTASQKFDALVHGQITYPNGEPAFTLATLAYRPDIEAILEQEARQRRELVIESLMLDGMPVEVAHSVLDMGKIADLLDGDLATLARTAEANPFVVELRFESPRRLAGVQVRVGSEPVTLAVTASPASGAAQTQSAAGNPSADYKDLLVRWEEPFEVAVLRIELLDDGVTEPAHVHLWEVVLIEE